MVQSGHLRLIIYFLPCNLYIDMYVYEHDPETGGLLLIDKPSIFSKEPRPVYAAELDLLGFDKYWQYDKQNDTPYMWAESNNYWYRGIKIASINNGALYNKPLIKIQEYDNGDIILPLSTRLIKIDIERMVLKNIFLLNILKKRIEIRILQYFNKLKNKLDCFYVAFSGGKDSIVLLDLVYNALPENSFFALFGDTGMELPDTYDLIEKAELDCKNKNIPFFRATSNLSPDATWQIFGPPAKTLRWCCSVHKSAPQILKLREITKNKNCIGMAMVGVREYESTTRSNYKIFNYSKKQKGQYSLHPILDWSSAEIWLYIFYRKLLINTAYKKGISRVGCLCCPMSAEGNRAWFKTVNYPEEYNKYINHIKSCLSNECDKDEYVKNNLWIQRYSGRDLLLKNSPYQSYFEDKQNITVNLNQQLWKEWKKTLPVLPFPLTETIKDNKLSITIPPDYCSTEWSKIIRDCAIKSAYCINCGTCEANCPNGAITNLNGKLFIDNCLKCGLCHTMDDPCLHFRSIRIPHTEARKMVNYNTLENYDIKASWFIDFFKNGNNFLKNNQLGPKQKVIFKRFLRYADLIDKKEVTAFFDKLTSLGYDSLEAWQLFLINSANFDPQIKWYIKNLPTNVTLPIENVRGMLQSHSIKDTAAASIIKAFQKLCDLQFGTILNFGTVTTRGSNLETLCRTKPVAPDPRVYLYGLYKFAEACNGYYEFSLGRLMDFDVEAEAVSPSEIFGLSRNETEQYLRGLAQNHPDYVLNFSTTHGMETLNLNPDKTSVDVLTLF